MSDHLNEGAPLPPRGQLRWHKITSPTRGMPLGAVILGETFVGRWTHYVPPTLPCAMTADCHYCKAGLAARYNGYIPALIGNPGQLRVLALTYFGAVQFTDLLKERGSLRGLVVTLSRKFKSERAPIIVKVERELAPDAIPESFDVMDSLARMWGINIDFLKRGCRRLGAGEDAATYWREEMKRRMSLGQNDIPEGEDAA